MNQSTVCVIRTVKGIDQYVPVNTLPSVNKGERSFSGAFRLEYVNDGPSNSHRRTIALPSGRLTEGRIS